MGIPKPKYNTRRKQKMKEETYQFVKTYIECCKESNANLKLDDASTNTKLAKALKTFKEADESAYHTVVELEKKEVLLEYLKIMKKYVDKRKWFRFTYVDVSKKTGIPVNSLKRVEALHSISGMSMILAMMKAVNLEFKIE